MVEEVLPLGFIVERPRSAFNNCFVVDHGWRAQNCRAAAHSTKPQLAPRPVNGAIV